MKKTINVLLVCAAGNSTSILVRNMEQDLAEEENWLIDARGISDLPNIVGKYNFILVAPQIQYNMNHILELTNYFDDIEVIPIPQNIYALCDGKAVNNLIRFHNMDNPREKEIENMSEAKTNGFMDKLQNWMMQYLVPVANKIGNQRHLAAVRGGLSIIIPASIVGGFAMLLAVPPIPSTVTEASNFFYAFLLAWKSWASANIAILMTPYYLTIGIVSLYAVCGVSYMLASHYKMEPLNNMVSALLVYLIISGAIDLGTATLSISRLGAGYMFAAMITGILVVEITHAFDTHNIKIKLPDSVPPNVAGPFNVLLALLFNVVVFTIINQLLITFTGGGIPDLIYTIFTPLMHATSSLPSILFLSFLSGLFWFFGIHGDNMMSAVTSPITIAALAANAEAVAAGTALPYIYAGSVTAVFGGWLSGNCGMNIYMRFFAKSPRIKSLSKVACVPAFFNIAEPYVFGLPEVLNLFYFIPSTICMVLNISTYYFLASADIVGKFYISLPFTTPAPLQAFLATGGDVRTLILSLVLLVIDIFIYMPFIKAYDNQCLKEDQEAEATKENA